MVHGFQRRVDQSKQCLLKQTACCVTQKRKMRSTATKRERKKQVKWIPFDPQPPESSIVTLSRYYATNKTNPEFQKKVSFFRRNTDATLGNVALYEYQGSQFVKPIPH